MSIQMLNRLAQVRLVMADMSPVGVMTKAEVARAFGISQRTFDRWRLSRSFPFEPMPMTRRKVLFLRSDVERVLSGQKRIGRRVA